jgi:hypothetical protein
LGASPIRTRMATKINMHVQGGIAFPLDRIPCHPTTQGGRG